MGQWMLPVRSRRYSTRPALASSTTRADIVVRNNRPRLGRGHQAARTEDTTETTDVAHHIRYGDGDVEICPAAEDLLNALVVIDDVVGSRFLRCTGGFSRGEDQDTHGLAQTIG